MNPYLLAFSLYALLITPVTVHASVRIGRGVRYRVRIQAAGLPFIRRSDVGAKEEAAQEEEERAVRGEDVRRTLAQPWLWPLLRALGVRRLVRLLGVLRLERLHVRMRISFDDAAATALCFSGLQAAMRALACAGALPRVLTGRVEADFGARGTEVYASGIIGARLGSLGVAAVRVGAALALARAEQERMEEETYAAASH